MKFRSSKGPESDSLQNFRGILSGFPNQGPKLPLTNGLYPMLDGWGPLTQIRANAPSPLPGSSIDALGHLLCSLCSLDQRIQPVCHEACQYYQSWEHDLDSEQPTTGEIGWLPLPPSSFCTQMICHHLLN